MSVSHGMEDLADRDIERALIALKKGAQLLKYGRKGNPKIYLLRLSDAVFQRNLHTEKEKLALSITHNNGRQSLDLICKDKVDAEIWTEGLKTLMIDSISTSWAFKN